MTSCTSPRGATRRRYAGRRAAPRAASGGLQLVDRLEQRHEADPSGGRCRHVPRSTSPASRASTADRVARRRRRGSSRRCRSRSPPVRSGPAPSGSRRACRATPSAARQVERVGAEQRAAGGQLAAASSAIRPARSSSAYGRSSSPIRSSRPRERVVVLVRCARGRRAWPGRGPSRWRCGSAAGCRRRRSAGRRRPASSRGPGSGRRSARRAEVVPARLVRRAVGQPVAGAL